jgi:polyisoprenoid-binding protein YceI
MKTVSFFSILAAGLLSLAAVASAPKDGNYNADSKATSIKWLGRKVTGEHFGKVNLKSGSFSWKGGMITAGMFEVDMNSMTCEDLTDATYNGKLIGHLKSDDFFSVEKFNTASFKLTKADKGSKEGSFTVTGDLTIKGKTLPVTFPVTVTEAAGKVTVSGDLTFDRAKYDIRYGSGSFFEGLGDKLIYDEVKLTLNIVANESK